MLPLFQVIQLNKTDYVMQADFASEESLDEFLASVETEAYRLAVAATRDPDEAVDLVQDAMITLVRKYRNKSIDEWAPLFHRILQNRIRDWYRRRKASQALLRWTGLGEKTELVAAIEAPQEAEPDRLVDGAHELAKIQRAIEQLPLRQQQTFLLRAWKEYSVEETADALSISTGSVKTHYARALSAMRQALEMKS